MVAVAGIGERAYSPEKAAIARLEPLWTNLGTNFAVSAARRPPKSGKERLPPARFTGSGPPRAAWAGGGGRRCRLMPGCQAAPSADGPHCRVDGMVEGGRGIWECIRRQQPTHQTHPPAH